MTKGYLAIVLHAHLPYVRHPEHPIFLEESWLYEAITETYIPLIHVFEGLVNDGIDFRFTMSLTPPLISMLQDGLLQERYIRHLERLLELTDKEIHRTRREPHFQNIARKYQADFHAALVTFRDSYGRDLTRAFRHFQELGKLEIITCAATHGYLPLVEMLPQAIRAQVQVGVNNYEQALGSRPRGIWLPECGYFPGLDNYLKEVGLRYFFLDTHGVIYSRPRPRLGVNAPIYCPSGVAAFGRDVESSKQVWSAKEGYPGDFCYRDFYRDAGFDLPFDYIKDYIHPDGIRVYTGLKYYRITGTTVHKEPYDPGLARERAAEHAGNFMFNRQKQADYLQGVMGRKPIIVAPYDAELFGHWWYEGPQFLDFLARKIACDQSDIRLIHPWEYLDEYPLNQVCTPAASSWGYKGYHEVWLEGSNDWIYRHLHIALKRMIYLANKFYHAEGDLRRALNQAAREVLLAQSSDWAFILKTQTAVDYAARRVKSHLNRFLRLYHEIEGNRINTERLKALEASDPIFPNIDFRVFCG